MNNIATTKVSKIVAQNYKAAQVFTTHGIDFCCNGGIPVEQACQAKNLDTEAIVREIELALATQPDQDFAAMPLDKLADYIVETHHTYVKNTLPTLVSYLQKLCRVHGERHPELFEITNIFEQSAVDLTQHMIKEEHILFPFVHQLVTSQKDNSAVAPPHFGHVRNPITMMEDEHTQEGDRFKKIAAITDNYTPPSDGCQTYKVAFMVLQEFEEDLHKHIHLENNILFPKAIEMYDDVYANHN